jgi:hypothetical protein
MPLTPRPRQPGLVYLKLVGAIDDRVRRVINGPKAPYGRFRSMPPRRPLVGGLKLVGFYEEAPAAWAQTLAAIAIKKRK